MSLSLESVVPNPFADAPETSALSGELLAFLIVGSAGAVAFVALSSIAIGLHTGAPNWLMSTLCYAALIVPVYLMHRRFSFRSDAPHMQALPRYAAVQLCALVLASLFSFVTYGVFAMPTLWASVLVTGLTAGVNFVVLRAWAFAHHAKPATATQPAAISR